MKKSDWSDRRNEASIDKNLVNPINKGDGCRNFFHWLNGCC